MPADRNYLERELEDRLRDDPEVWTFLRSSSLDGVWYWDLENPENEYMSPEFWRTFGFDPATKTHRAIEWQHLIHPEDLELAKANVARHIADPAHPYDQIVRYTCADGSIAWVRCRGMAVRDAQGKAIRLLGAHNDVTELMREKQAQAGLVDELQTIFNATTSGIVAFDDTGQVSRINSRARHMLGGISDPTPFVWPPAVRFLDPETLQPLAAEADPLRRILAGESLGNETHMMRRLQEGEERRYVRVQSARVENAHSGIDSVMVLDDVSAEERSRQVVERKSRLDALGQLTGGIAHDFNNLLASLLYAVDLARKAESDEKRDTYLSIAARSVERGRALTTRLLAFARRQPGLAEVRRTGEVLEDFRRLVRPMIEAQFDIQVGVDDPELRHFCDQTQLESALMNLVLNSRDAILRAGKGSRIEIRARPVGATSDDLDNRQVGGSEHGAGIDGGLPDGMAFRYVEITVMDDGPGMNADTLARCTDPFFTTKDTNSGTGLGLAMVYGFTTQSNGDLRIYSDEGVGTTVQITLPRGAEDGHREDPVPASAARQGAGQTILVVEDEVILQMMMTEVLEDLGYQVLTASSGAEALALVEAGMELDLLLTDVVMPGPIGGFDLARRVRAINPDVPVIYSSGYTGFTASEMGDVQAPLLQKPAPPEEIAGAIAKALSERRRA